MDSRTGPVEGKSTILLLMPPVHNCGYVALRNSLIPAAERATLAELGHADAPGFAAAFFGHMDRLVAERLADPQPSVLDVALGVGP